MNQDEFDALSDYDKWLNYWNACDLRDEYKRTLHKEQVDNGIALHRRDAQLAKVTKERDEARERIAKLEKVREVLNKLGWSHYEDCLLEADEDAECDCDMQKLDQALAACEEKEPTGE